MTSSIRLSLSVLALLLSSFPLANAGLAPGSNPWNYSGLAYRREVSLPADPDNSRTNAPVFLDLKLLGPVDLATLKVDDITGNSPVSCPVAAYAQPSGRDPRAFWAAAGTTAAGASRRFAVYYNKLSSWASYPMNWSRAGASFGTKSTVKGGYKYQYFLTGDRLEFMRNGYDKLHVGDDQHCFFQEQGTSYYECRNLSTGFSCLSGIRQTYAFLGAQFTTPFVFCVTDQERYFDSLTWDRNGPTAAFSAHFTITDQIAHQTEITHRIFQGQPLLEYSVTATPKSGPWLEFSDDIYSSRKFYSNSDAFNPTRQLNDLGQDTSPSSDENVSKWTILADSNSNAIGLFSFKPGSKSSSSGSLLENGAVAAEQGSFYLYYAVGKTSDLKILFSTMKRGYPLGVEQQTKFDINTPAEGDRFIVGEAINATVAGPAANATDLSLRIDFPDGSYQVLKPATPATSVVFNLGTVSASSKFGTWKLTATSGGVSRTRQIAAVNPEHPRVLFTASELTRIRARWKTDSLYQGHIQSRLTSSANDILAQAPLTPTPVDNSMRYSARDLLDLAGALLMDPTNQAIRTRMWSDFRNMMSWPQWDPIGNSCLPFDDEDTGRGEALTELVTVYDWFYSDLSVGDRRKYADLFARYGDALLSEGKLPLRVPFYFCYNSIDNSRTVSKAAGLAGIDRLLMPEINDARHLPWRTRLNANFTTLLNTLCTDGSYNAGESYHGLMLWPLFFWSESRRLNGDTSLYSSTWFKELPYYIAYGMMPGRVGNFGGMMPFGNCNPSPYYSLQTDLALPSLRGAGSPTRGLAQWIAENIGYTRVEPYQAAWEDYSLPQTDPATLPNWHTFSRRGIFVFRSSWANNAMYFATKCGEYWGGHEHPDLGTFVLHRNGYPYIAAPHYVKNTNTTDENIMLANGKALRGRNGMYSDPTDPMYWGKTLRALGSPNYFNVLQNPEPAYEDGSNLKSYNREFVGFSDLVILRDSISATASSEFRLMFHGYKTDPQTESGTPYKPDAYPTAQVFEQPATGRIRLYPNKTATPNEWLTILDLSRTNWTTSIGAWMLEPNTSSGEKDSAAPSYGTLKQRGGQLTRIVSGATAATGLQVMHFRSDSFSVRPWSSSVSNDGLIAYYGTTTNEDDRFKVVWPKNGAMTNVTGAEGLTVTGAMAMRNYENMEFGGRDLTYLRDDSTKGEKAVLVSSNVPITIGSQTAKGIGSAWIACDSAAKVTLYFNKATIKPTFNGKAITASGTGKQVTLSIPATPAGRRVEFERFGHGIQRNGTLD